MTNEKPPPGPLRRGLATGRLEAFSDGVFAIAITLLVLNIAVRPSAGKLICFGRSLIWGRRTWAMWSASPMIGAMWLGHNAITEYLERTDAVFWGRSTRYCFLVIAFLPFPTRLLAEFIGQGQPRTCRGHHYTGSASC